MNRVIKFRAWDSKSKKWWSHEETLSLLLLQGRVIDKIANDEKNLLGRYTIEQFTGLLDKNGKEIYEGDIIKSEFSRPLKVSWSEANARYIARDVKQYQMNVDDHLSVASEVIGNIHKNPELLEPK